MARISESGVATRKKYTIISSQSPLLNLLPSEIIGAKPLLLTQVQWNAEVVGASGALLKLITAS